jgi:nicotinamidase-related amidase
MAITKLDSNVALVLIDLQKGVVGLPAVHSAGQIVARAARQALAFRERGLPVVLVNVTGVAPGRTEVGRPKFAFPEGWTELVPELEQQPSDFLVSKQRLGAFIGTPLDSYLRSRGVTQVV